MRRNWWKILAVILLLYTFIAGLLIRVPYVGNLYESIRNLYFHVCMWFASMVLLTVSAVNAVLYLRKPGLQRDNVSYAYAQTGILFSALGLGTGMIWANYTWGAPWSNDPKQLGAAIALLIYLAYLVLRSSITDPDSRARVSAVYNIFAYFILFPTLWILPRMVQSLHPGGKGVDGNPGFGGDSLDPTMETVFWPAVLGWSLLGVWISTLQARFAALREKLLES